MVVNWNKEISGFKSFLKIEKALSANSIKSYLDDVSKLIQFLEIKNIDLKANQVKFKHIKDFLIWITELGISARSQARIISG
ncbi:MAG: tyrosine recombinase XerD, partial [Bacteroidetes bacterium]